MKDYNKLYDSLLEAYKEACRVQCGALCTGCILNTPSGCLGMALAYSLHSVKSTIENTECLCAGAESEEYRCSQ